MSVRPAKVNEHAFHTAALFRANFDTEPPPYVSKRVFRTPCNPRPPAPDVCGSLNNDHERRHGSDESPCHWWRRISSLPPPNSSRGMASAGNGLFFTRVVAHQTAPDGKFSR